MDLRELRYFRAIAEFGTFTKAAAYLRVAQPALTRQIQKLEHDLGVPLLRRTSRGVTMTAAGQVLLQRTRWLEEELEATQREVASYAEVVTGSLRIALQYPVSVLMAPSLMRSFREHFPGVVLHFIDGVHGNIVNGLLDCAIDVAILEAPSHDHSDLVVTPLWTEPVLLVGPPSAPGFDGPFSLAQVMDLPLIMPSRNHAMRRIVEAAFARRQLRFQPAIEADGALMILEMVKAGLGYTLMPPCVWQPMAAAGELRAAEVQPPIRRTVASITRASLLSERAVSAFLAMVRQAAPPLVSSERFGPAALWNGTGQADGQALDGQASGPSDPLGMAAIAGLYWPPVPAGK